MRYASLIERISTAASRIAIRSLGCCFEQDTASPITEATHPSLQLLTVAAHAGARSFSFASSCSQIAGSAISKALLGRAVSAYLWRSKESLNMSSVGLLPVNISSNSMPRLKDFRYAEISNPSTHVFCKEDVTWLEIAMDYWRLALIVKVVQSVHDIDSNV
ncbi:hypothetical protein U9M48_020793 [Paspalum notatum var. saurae]|uniref:Uncharacterized protein n=1 Tax=Paspalum notatum var. saurae TaxID=547442 RepID=A0AAQ3WST5_PASNO